MKLYLALFLWVVPMTAMKVSSVNLDLAANMSQQERMKQKILAGRANAPNPVNVTIGYTSATTTEGQEGFTREHCTRICNSQVMIAQGYNLALFGINPNNPSWDVGNVLANMEVFSASSPLGQSTNVVNYKNTGRKSFLKKIVFDPRIYDLDNEEICVAINIISIGGVVTFQLRWVDEPITPTTEYGPASVFQPTPEPRASMIQFADLANGATSFTVQNFAFYKIRATFCQRTAQTNYNVRVSVVGDPGLSAFNTYMCPGYETYCDQLGNVVASDTSGSPFNFLTASKGTNMNVPDVQVAIFGFGGFNNKQNDGTYTLIFSEF